MTDRERDDAMRRIKLVVARADGYVANFRGFRGLGVLSDLASLGVNRRDARDTAHEGQCSK